MRAKSGFTKKQKMRRRWRGRRRRRRKPHCCAGAKESHPQWSMLDEFSKEPDPIRPRGFFQALLSRRLIPVVKLTRARRDGESS